MVAAAAKRKARAPTKSATPSVEAPAEDLLVLVDGSHALHRAFGAAFSLTGRDGGPNGAVFAVARSLLALLRERRPSHMAVVFDARGKKFRHRMYPDYKKGRPPLPPDLEAQFEPLQAVIHAMGIPVVTAEDVEADDVIGTLAWRAQGDALPVVVVSGDKDLAQVVSDSVRLHDPAKNVTLDYEGVWDKFGVPPEYLPHLFALQGDSSDNIPGVRGVGPKTAAALIQEFGSLGAVYANLDRIRTIEGLRGRERLAATLLEQRDNALLSLDLTELVLDVPLEVAPRDLVVRPPDLPALRATEFRFLHQWADEFSTSPEDLGTRYVTVAAEADWTAFAEEVAAAPAAAVAVYAAGAPPVDIAAAGVAVAVGPRRAFYILLDGPATAKRLSHVMRDCGTAVGHDTKLLGHALATAGAAVPFAEDTMLQSYVLNSGASHKTLEGVQAAFLGPDPGPKPRARRPREAPTAAVVAERLCQSADLLLGLSSELTARLRRHPGLGALYRDLERPLAPVLGAMERRGVLLDPGVLEERLAAATARRAALEREAHALVGHEFNLRSPKQLQEVLYTELGLSPSAKTTGGAPSTDAAALQALAPHHPLPGLLSAHREVSKQLAYLEGLPRHCRPDTHRVHSTFLQAATITGRLSSAEPNLQNIPVAGWGVRRAVVAPAGHVLLSADYSQIELRVMAHLARDPTLTAAFHAGLDIHRATAAEIFSVPLEDVTKEQRQAAKTVNFGLLYGMGPGALGKQLGVSTAEASAYIDGYFRRYPGVRTYMDATLASAQEHGFVETLCGRRIHVAGVLSGVPRIRSEARNLAINAPVQGTAADLIKRAMLAVHRWLGERPDLATHLVLQVHDELVLEVPLAAVPEVEAAVARLMADALPLSVPVVVNTKRGPNWEDLE